LAELSDVTRRDDAPYSAAAPTCRTLGVRRVTTSSAAVGRTCRSISEFNSDQPQHDGENGAGEQPA